MTNSTTPAKVTVVGTGYWGKNLVRNFYNLGALHSVCDLNRNAVNYFTGEYPGTIGLDSYADVLANEDVQGIVLATPAPTHAPLAREALLAGKDVYVEKPLCLDEKDGEELNRLAKENQRILMVGHLLWYHSGILRLKELIDTGELGRIRYIYSNRLNIGKLRREENVLWSFAPHDISVILGLTNEMPVSIQAQGGNFLHQKIADTTVTMLNFASGIQAHIFVSWLHPFKEQKLVVVCDKKMAVFDDTAPWPEKLTLFYRFLEHARGCTDAIYILGDLFEIWLGDDDDSEPHPEVVAALADLTSAAVALYVMRGNRDFLLGDDFARKTGATMLPDYHVLDLFGMPTVLTHGDLLCTKDVKYQAFRKYVQDPRHQADFLSRDLPERRRLAAEMRSGTKASMLEKDDFIMDVDDDTVVEAIRAFSVQRLIHGHTHRPGLHTFEVDGVPCSRVVLGDWYEQDSLVVSKPSGITQHRVGEFLAG